MAVRAAPAATTTSGASSNTPPPEPALRSAEHHHENLNDEGAQIAFRDLLRQIEILLRSNLDGPASLGAFVTTIARYWITETKNKYGQGGYLEIELDESWQIESATLHAVRSARVAEALMQHHGGRLDPMKLGVRVEVWFKKEADWTSGKAYGSLFQDGSWLPKAGQDASMSHLEEQLASRGLPIITELK